MEGLLAREGAFTGIAANKETQLAYIVASGGEPPGEPRHRVGFMLRKGDTSMKDAIAAAIKQLQSDGTYDSLLKKWGLKDGDIRLFAGP